MFKTNLVAFLCVIIFFIEAYAEQDYCSNVSEKDTFDCHPEYFANKEECQKRGCCWRDYTENHGQPFCFFPSNQPSYNLVDWAETEYGYKAHLKKVNSYKWPGEIVNVTLKIWFETQTRLRIKFYDKNASRWEVPIDVPPPPTSKPTLVDYKVEYVASPFGLKITRTSNGAILFDSTIPTSPLTLSDQFLQISTRLSSPLLYGIGERYGPLLINTTDKFHRFSLWNRDQLPTENANLYGSHAFMLNTEVNSDMSHGIFLLNSNAMDIEARPGPYVTLTTVGGVLDLYVFTGPSSQNVVQQYVQTVGLPVLPPLWSLGFHLCRWKYRNTAHLKEVVQRNRDLGLSYDVQWSDIDYMHNAWIWTIDEDNYSDLPKFVEELHDHGQKYVIIVDPAVALNYPVYEDGLAKNVYVRDVNGDVLEGQVWPGTTVFPDFSHPNVSDWWFQHANDFHSRLPYDGLWIDMNEPSSFIQGSVKGCSDNHLDKPPHTPRVTGENLAAQTICPSAQHNITSHYNFHNLYGLYEAIVTQKALQRIRPNKRNLIISRSTFPSHGKHASHWTGDVRSAWKDLQYSISSILSFQFFGISLVGADICGFSGDTTEELCVRWMQLGAFYPFMRNHNDDKSRDQDPASWGEEAQNAMKKATHLRYALLPFFYTQFFHNHLDGTPVVKPLFFEFPNDKETYGIDRQFLWGRSLLVSPALEDGQRTVKAYFPEAHWFNVFTGYPIKSSGEYLDLATPLDAINIHLKAGHLIPWQEHATTTVLQRSNSFKLTVALDSQLQAEGNLFWDDGESEDSIEKKKYTFVEFKAESSTLYSRIKEAGYNKTGELTLSDVFLFNVESHPYNVKLNNRSVAFSYDGPAKKLYVSGLNHSLLEPFVLKWH